jgi:hypothetical protein
VCGSVPRCGFDLCCGGCSVSDFSLLLQGFDFGFDLFYGEFFRGFSQFDDGVAVAFPDFADEFYGSFCAEFLD